MKYRTKAAYLAIFLGCFGVHKFYLDKGYAGVLYLVLCWTGIPTILGIFEGIIYLTQSEDVFAVKQNIAKTAELNMDDGKAFILDPKTNELENVIEHNAAVTLKEIMLWFLLFILSNMLIAYAVYNVFSRITITQL